MYSDEQGGTVVDEIVAETAVQIVELGSTDSSARAGRCKVLSYSGIQGWVPMTKPGSDEPLIERSLHAQISPSDIKEKYGAGACFEVLSSSCMRESESLQSNALCELE